MWGGAPSQLAVFCLVRGVIEGIFSPSSEFREEHPGIVCGGPRMACRDIKVRRVVRRTALVAVSLPRIRELVMVGNPNGCTDIFGHAALVWVAVSPFAAGKCVTRRSLYGIWGTELRRIGMPVAFGTGADRPAGLAVGLWVEAFACISVP